MSKLFCLPFEKRIICFRLNTLPLHPILEESNFSFKHVRLSDLDIPREKNS